MYKLITFYILNMLFMMNHCFGGFDLPNKFYVKEHWLSWTRTFDIQTDHENLGEVHRTFFSWLPQYEFYNSNKELQALAKMRFLTFGAEFDIYAANPENTLIGRVEERIFKLFPTFDIISPTGKILVQGKMNFLGTRYELKNYANSDHLLATLSRSYLRLKDDWIVEISDREFFEQHNIDPKLFILIMAFQTDVDHWKARNQHSDTSFGNHSPSPDCETREALDAQLSQCRESLSSIELSQEELDRLELEIDSYVNYIQSPLPKDGEE